MKKSVFASILFLSFSVALAQNDSNIECGDEGNEPHSFKVERKIGIQILNNDFLKRRETTKILFPNGAVLDVKNMQSVNLEFVGEIPQSYVEPSLDEHIFEVRGCLNQDPWTPILTVLSAEELR